MKTFATDEPQPIKLKLRGRGHLYSTSGSREPGATTNRLSEQLRYAYDPAGNLNWRTNNALAQQFSVNNLNELTTVSRTGDSTLTVAGTTTSLATNVIVNGFQAGIYADSTFAREGFTLVDGTNSFTAIAQDSYGRTDTNSSTAYLPATVSLVYDLNGNLRTNGLEVLEYDDENQLVSNWVAASWKSEFVYDGLHRRRVQRDYVWSSGIWNLKSEIHLVYDGYVPLQHRDANNWTTLTLARGLDLNESLHGAGGIGGLLAMTASTLPAPASSPLAQSYYHCDAGGNITCLVNGAQVVTAQASYDPYGAFLSVSGPAASLNPYWFSSKPLHRQSGHYDFLYRWYAPELQRWLNRDPLREAGGINLYGFAGNSPINYIDPYGLHWADWSFFQWWERVTRPLRGLNPDGSERSPRGGSGMSGPQEDTVGLQPSLLGELLLPGGGVFMSGGSSRCGARSLAEAAARRQAAIQEALKTALRMRDSAGTALSVAMDARKAAEEALRAANASYEFVGEQFGKD